MAVPDNSLRLQLRNPNFLTLRLDGTIVRGGEEHVKQSDIEKLKSNLKHPSSNKSF
jgi:hypothetical protein